jgi:hypothetical protein
LISEAEFDVGEGNHQLLCPIQCIALILVPFPFVFFFDATLRYMMLIMA